MRWIALLCLLFQTLFLGAQVITPPTPPLPHDATNPPYLPVVLVNNSGLDPSQIHFVVKGTDTVSKTLPAVLKNITAPYYEATLQVLNVHDNTQSYDLTLADLPTVSPGSNAYYFYTPQIISAQIMFSIGQSLSIPVVSSPAGPGFQDPNFLSPSDPYFQTQYGFYEYNYYISKYGNLFADGSAVSYFSLPLFGYLSTPNPTSLNYSGLSSSYQSIMNKLSSYFNGAFGVNERQQWNRLFMGNVRCVSPGKGTTAPSTSTTQPFDPNYLDNLTAYGYSYLQDIWYGTNGYYKSHVLTLTLPANNRTYTGQVQADNTFLFTATDGSGYVVTFAAPSTTSNPTTTQMILENIDMHVTDTSNSGDGVIVSQLFQDAVITGLIPTETPLSQTYFRANQSQYYKVNTNLSPFGQTSGPWYDLYSAALHSYAQNSGSPSTSPTLYTIAYDEPLWPQVVISAAEVQTTPPETFLGVILYPLQGGSNTPTVTLSSSINPSTLGQAVTFTTAVSASSGTPTGTINLVIDGTQVSSTTLVNGQTTYSTSSLSAGTHTLTAEYSGDAQFSPATSNTLIQTVQGTATETTLTSSSNPSDVGQSVTFTAHVTSSAGDPTGDVVFIIDGARTAFVSLNGSGIATYTTSSLALGSHTIQADYSGGGQFDPSTSNIITQLVVFVNPPRHAKGEQHINRFATQTDVINILTWKAPSTGATPIAYKIFADESLSKLIAVVDVDKSTSHSFKYLDHNCKKGKTYTYYIVSVDAQGFDSTPVQVIVHSHR